MSAGNLGFWVMKVNHGITKGGTGDGRRSFDVLVVTNSTGKTLDVLYAAGSYSSVRYRRESPFSFVLFKYKTGE